MYSLIIIFCQFPNIRVSDSLSTDPEEVTIALNPQNPLNLVAGANLNYYYYSMDGGYTWTEGILSSSMGVLGDPCVIFDADGNAYYAHLSIDQYWLDKIVVQKSTDGGVTWDDGAGVGYNPPRQQDKEWMIADMTTSPFRNNIYMGWTEFDSYGSSNPMDSTRILFSRSTDSGQNWMNPVRISEQGGNCLDSDSTVMGVSLAIGPNGEVYICWAGPSGIMFDRSYDGGISFGQDIFVVDQPGGWDFEIPGIYRCGGLPSMACDISNSPYKGTIYIVWSDQRNGTDDTDVFLIKSTDGGNTWGNMKRVNNDTTTRHQFFPWIAIDPITGYIYVVFYDRRNTTGNATEVYLARSQDGGETFDNFKISETPFIPYSWFFFGDYINITAYNREVRPIWMRMDNGDLSVWTAVIHDSMLSVKGIVSYPVSKVYTQSMGSSLTIYFNMSFRSSVRIEVFDISGKRIYKNSNSFNKGSHRFTLAENINKEGIYLCKIRLPDKIVYKKFIFLKK